MISVQIVLNCTTEGSRRTKKKRNTHVSDFKLKKQCHANLLVNAGVFEKPNNLVKIE